MTQGPPCHCPSLLSYDRWTTGVKGGGSTAHTARHLITSLLRLKGQLHVCDATNTSKPCSDGKGAKQQVNDDTGGRSPNPASRPFRILVDLGPETTAASWMTQQPSLGTALPALQGERLRKGSLTEARLSSHGWFGVINKHLLYRSLNFKTSKVQKVQPIVQKYWKSHPGMLEPCLVQLTVTDRNVVQLWVHMNCPD